MPLLIPRQQRARRSTTHGPQGAGRVTRTTPRASSVSGEGQHAAWFASRHPRFTLSHAGTGEARYSTRPTCRHPGDASHAACCLSMEADEARSGTRPAERRRGDASHAARRPTLRTSVARTLRESVIWVPQTTTRTIRLRDARCALWQPAHGELPE